MRATSRLRQLLKSGNTLFVPGCYNALSARILADVGFPAVYMTGYGTSLSLLGMPDAGLATMTEMHLNARYIANAVPVPVIADADNGYGNAINVMRTVREYIGTGVAGIHIEDQVIPKRCGHVAGRRVIPIEEASASTERPTPCDASSIRTSSSLPAPTRAAPAAARSTRRFAAPTRISRRAPISPSSRDRRTSRKCAACVAR